MQRHLGGHVRPFCARASYSVGASTVMHPLWQTVHVERSLPARIEAISNVFETGNPQADYAYVENLNDGRGYTVTSYGFCTSTGEVSELIRRYSMIAPDNPLKHFLAWMEPASASEERLGDFPAARRHEASVSNRLAAVCDEEADRLYFTPAMRAAEVADMRTPVGRLVFYDTWLQHGGDGDPPKLVSGHLFAYAATSRRSPGMFRARLHPRLFKGTQSGPA